MITSSYVAEEARRNLGQPAQGKTARGATWLRRARRYHYFDRFPALLDHGVGRQRPARTARGDRCRGDAPAHRRLPVPWPLLRNESRGGSGSAAGRIPHFENRIVRRLKLPTTAAVPVGRETSRLLYGSGERTPERRQSPLRARGFPWRRRSGLKAPRAPRRRGTPAPKLCLRGRHSRGRRIPVAPSRAFPLRHPRGCVGKEHRTRDRTLCIIRVHPLLWVCHVRQ
jgi:hypothetical protein